MTKEEAIALIDAHKNVILNPAEMLNWVWLRVIILNIGVDDWNSACGRAEQTFSR